MPLDPRRQKQLHGHAATLSLGSSPDLATIGRLSFGSVIRLGTDEDGSAVLIGRVRVGATGWYAEILDGEVGPYSRAQKLLEAGRTLVESRGYAERATP